MDMWPETTKEKIHNAKRGGSRPRNRPAGGRTGVSPSKDSMRNVTGRLMSQERKNLNSFPLISSPLPFSFFFFCLYKTRPTMFHLLLSSVSSSSDASLKQTHMIKSQDHTTSSKSGKTNSRPTKNKLKKERERGEGGGRGDAKKKNRLFSSAAEYQILYWSRIVARCKRFVHRNAHKSVVCNASKRRNKAFFVSLPSRHRWIDEWIRKRMIASRMGWHPRGVLTAQIFIHLLLAHFSVLYLFWLFSEFE